jgi:anti-sigma28 factor (negative regulator of flagellin synthesis)
MTIRGLDPSGELGRLFFHIQSKDNHAQEASSIGNAPPHSSADAVDLSVLAKEIRDYSFRALQFPDLREEKIQHIQQKLEAGTDLASSDQLAEAMIRETIFNALGS